MSDALKTVVVGDQAAQVAVADAQIIEKYKADQAKALADAKADHEKALATKDAEIAKKDAKIADLEKAKMSDAEIDKRVADRAALISTAAKIAKDVNVKGLSDADIRKAVVKAKIGDEAVADKSDAYIEARFDVLAEDADKGDPFADAMASAPTPQINVSDLTQVYADRNKALADAWKLEKKGA